MDFSDLYERYIDSIKASSYSQFVPGLDRDDVVAEMVTCLWKAHTTYRSGTTSFGSYWWSLWLNRKADILKGHYRLKNPVLVPKNVWEHVGHYDATIPCVLPPGSTRTERMVWAMLAQGFTPKDVIECCRLTQRAYYKIIRGWRNDTIKSLLTIS